MKTFSCLMVLVLVACGSDDPAPGASTGEGKLAITANWLDGTLSLVDVDALVSGVADRAAVETASIDLSAYSPGPLEVEITPDGKLALVAISAGFFSIGGAGFIVNEPSIPMGADRLLFVDIETRAVVGELDTGSGPMGIRITKDGTRAFVAHFGSGELVTVDIASRSIVSRVEIGGLAEEIAFDDSDTVGIVGYSTDGSVRTFAVDDVAGTLSAQVQLPGDSAGVAFFPGTKTAFVFQAANGFSSRQSGYTLIDVTDPSAPDVIADVRWTDTTMGYGIAVHPERNSVIVPLTSAGKLIVREFTLGDGDVVLANTVENVTDATLMGARAVSIDGQGRVLVAVPRERVLTVSDLDSGESFVVPWGTRASPADVAVW